MPTPYGLGTGAGWFPKTHYEQWASGRHPEHSPSVYVLQQKEREKDLLMRVLKQKADVSPQKNTADKSIVGPTGQNLGRRTGLSLDSEVRFPEFLREEGWRTGTPTTTILLKQQRGYFGSPNWTGHNWGEISARLGPSAHTALPVIFLPCFSQCWLSPTLASLLFFQRAASSSWVSLSGKKPGASLTQIPLQKFWDSFFVWPTLFTNPSRNRWLEPGARKR